MEPGGTEHTCPGAKDPGLSATAGDTLTMVSEPEAAASYCLKEA